MKQYLYIILFISSLSFASTINIAIASNVIYAMDELKVEFLKLHPDSKLRVIIGSSGKLSAQISNNAPYHIFMSANMQFPQKLYKSKMTITAPRVYAKGKLIYFSVKSQEFMHDMSFLKDVKISKIAIANPKTAPYGKATYEAMINAGVYDDIKHKLIYGESISQTLSYAVTAADIGFIAKSSIYSKQMSKYKAGVNYIDVSTKLYEPIEQGVVLLKHAKNNSDAKAFYDFIFTKKAREIFEKYGYLIP